MSPGDRVLYKPPNRTPRQARVLGQSTVATWVFGRPVRQVWVRIKVRGLGIPLRVPPDQLEVLE